MKTRMQLYKKILYMVLGISLAVGGTVFASQISVPSGSSAGLILQSLSNGNYFPVQLIAGSNISISSTSAAITISSTGGGASFPFTPTTYGNATGTTIGFTNGILVVGSSTFIGNATTTGTQFAGIASSSRLYGAGLYSCNSGNVLTWSGGLFGCATDQTAAGAANPFAWQTTYATTAAATSSNLWIQQNLFASSSAYFGSGGVGSSSIQVGSNSNEWVFGFLGSDNSFRISSGTALSINPVLTITKGTNLATLSSGLISSASTTINGNFSVATTTSGCASFGATGLLYSTGSACGTGGAFPYTPTTNFGVNTNATSTILNFTVGLFASSTSRIDTLALGSSTATAYTNAPLVITGNTNNYVQATIQNLSNGTNASGLYVATADVGNDNKYFTEVGINNSGYSQAAFSAQNPLDSFLTASDGALVIGTASTTNKLADLRFTVGGTASSSIRATFMASGFNGIGTTTPRFQLQVATSGVPQVVISNGTNPGWSFTDTGNGSFILASTSPNTFATSTDNIFSISSSGNFGFGSYNTSPSKYTFGSGCGSSINPNIKLGACDAADSRMGAIVGNKGTFLLAGTGTYGEVFAYDYAAAALDLVFNEFGGNVGAGTTTPWARLSVEATSLGAAPAFAVGSTTQTFFVIRNDGTFGFASSTPSKLWGISIATTTVFMNSQIAGAIASSSAQAATYTVDWNTGNTARYILNQSTNLVINATSSHPLDGGKYTLKLCQDGTGSRAVTFVTPGQLVWWNGTTTITSTANRATFIGMIYDARAQRYDVVASSTNLDARSCTP